MRAILQRDPPTARMQVWFRTGDQVLARNAAGDLVHIDVREGRQTATTQDLPVLEIPDDQWDAILLEIEAERTIIPAEVVELQEDEIADLRVVRDRLLTIVERNA